MTCASGIIPRNKNWNIRRSKIALLVLLLGMIVVAAAILRSLNQKVNNLGPIFVSVFPCGYVEAPIQGLVLERIKPGERSPGDTQFASCATATVHRHLGLWRFFMDSGVIVSPRSVATMDRCIAWLGAVATWAGLET